VIKPRNKVADRVELETTFATRPSLRPRSTASGRFWGRLNLRLATLVIGWLIVFTIVGVIVKLLLDDIGSGDTCPYCSAGLAGRLRICPRCHKVVGKR
jgi:hypothetical protein